MRIEIVNGVQQNSYTPQTKPIQPIDQIKKVQKVGKDYQKEVGKPKLSENASKIYEKLKEKFGDADFTLVSKENMDMVKRDPSKFNNTSQTAIFISEEELEKMANDEDYAKEMEENIAQSFEKLPEIKNELDKKGAPVTNMGMIFEDGKISVFAQLEKTVPKTEGDKLLDRTKEKYEKRHEEEVKEIRKKYAPKKRPSDETTIIKRDDKITIISNSILDLTAAISDFGMDYFMKPQQDVGINVDARA